VWIGPWKLSLAWIPVSVSGPRKPFSLAIAALVLWCLAHPRVRSAFGAHSSFAFYVIATILLWCLTWGPDPKALGFRFLYQAPYRWLMRLPGFSSGLRVPARFAMPAALTLAVAAGLALARLLPPRREWRVRACAAFFVFGILADGWMRPVPMLQEPSMWAVPSSAPQFKAVLELPLVIGGDSDAAAVYRGLYHGHPTVNGFSGYFPVHYFAMRRGLESGDETVLSALAAWGPILIAINRSNDADGRWSTYLLRNSLVAPVASSGTWNLFLLRATASRAAIASERLAVERVTSNFTTSDWRVLVDDDALTRWATWGPQRGDEAVVVDLGAVRQVSGISVSLGAFDIEYPKALTIETSSDGDQWKIAWRGPTAGLAVAAAIINPRDMELDFRFDAVREARYIRLRQMERDDVYRWSLAGIRVWGSLRSQTG
jgi:F5/8 type C domain